MFLKTFTRAGIAVPMLLAGAQAAADQMQVAGSFPGTSYLVSGFFPPDTMGAVGPEHFVELVNGRYVVQEKVGGDVLQSSSLDAFWLAAGVNPDGAYAFDPRILYDPASGRWFAVSVDAAEAPNNFLVAVSDSWNPTDGWTGFKIDADTDNQQWADFPTVGLDDEGLYVAGRMFPLSAGPFVINLLVLPKADLLLPVPAVTNATLLEDIDPGVTGPTIQPAVDLDPGGGFAVPILSRYDGTSLRRTTLTGSVLNPVLTPGVSIPTAAFFSPPDAEQPQVPFPKPDIHTGDARIGGCVVLRDGILWAVHHGDVGGRSAVRFLKIDASTGALLQSSLIADPELAYYYPSIAVNEFGDVAIGFSGSSLNQPASAYAAGGTTEASVTTLSPPILLREGLENYAMLDGLGRNRWGDYSATVVDPVDPKHFWTVQEFVLVSDIWATQVTELVFADFPANDLCAAATPVGDGSYPFDSSIAGTDGFPTDCGGGGGTLGFVRDIWYRYTAACTGTATFTTCNEADFDTRIALYFPVACGPVTPLACNDDADGCGTSSSVSLAVFAGFDYLVRVGGTAQGGSGTLTISCRPFQDACPWDCADDDGEVGINDFLALLAQWGMTGSSCDLGLGAAGTGIDEFLDLLAHWGRCAE